MERSSAIVTTLGAAAAATALFLLLRRGGVEDMDESGGAPELAPDDVVTIFNELSANMNERVLRMMQSIREHKAQLPEQYISQMLVQQFESTLTEFQEEVFARHNTTAEDVEDAVRFYEENDEEEVQEAVKRLKHLYLNIGGMIDVDVPDELDVDKMCVVLSEYMEAYIEAQEELLLDCKAKGKQPDSPEFAQASQKKTQEKTGEVLERHGLTIMVFQNAVKKFNDNKKFQAKVKEVEAKQVERLQALGIQPGAQ